MVSKKSNKIFKKSYGFPRKSNSWKTYFSFVSKLKNLRKNEMYLKSEKCKNDIFRRATRQDFMYEGSFQEAMAPVLVMAQVFALLPVSGVQSKSATNLKFSWRQFRTIHSVVMIVLEIFFGAMTFWWAFSQPIQFKNYEPLIFNTTVTIVSVKFLFLARKWPKFMKDWENVEVELPKMQNQKEKSMLAYRIKMITFVAMVLSLIEHLLSMISALHYANMCPARPDPIESYFAGQSNALFTIFDFSIWIGLLGKWINIFSTFAWNFMDVFVMLVGVGLASRFKLVNDSLMKVKGLEMPELFWLEHRLHYRRLCVLCDEIDKSISLITLISFSNNLYFICVKLLRSLNRKPSYAHAAYFWFSLIFLLGRTLMISLYSAEVADQAKRPLKVFRWVPRNSWCNEIKRFADEVSSDLIALSGMRFFHITRSLVLTVAGTIVTYELVLIQFQENKIDIGDCA